MGGNIMTVQAAPTRPPARTSGGAGLGALLQLAIFVVVVVTFLAAPLLALGVAFLVYTVMRSRGESSRAGGAAADVPVSVTGFGSGAR
jgi:hypothetical protein